jgi:hypothetical protein
VVRVATSDTQILDIIEDINMANRNFANSRIYTGHVMPVLLDCNFIVDSANGNGLGIRSLKGPYIQNVFMHTTATPGLGNANPSTPAFPILNPNPSSGIIVVQMQDNFSRSLTGFSSIISPLGSSQVVTSGLTVGESYTITIVGDATAADWVALGLPSQTVPSAGATFIAKSTGTGASTVTRVAPVAAAGSTIGSIETQGDPNQTISSASVSSQGFGSQFILNCFNRSGSVAAPADGTVISLSFLLSNSSILIAGE